MSLHIPIPTPRKIELSNELQARFCAMEIVLISLLRMSPERKKVLELMENLALMADDLFSSTDEKDRSEISRLLRERLAWFVASSGGPDAQEPRDG